MMCKIHVSKDQFRDWFADSQYENNFTYEQLGLLYEHIESLEEETGSNPYNDNIFLMICLFDGYTKRELLKEYATEEHPDIDSLIDYLRSKTSICYDSKQENFIVEAF